MLNGRTYLADRLPGILLFGGNVLLTLLVVNLGLLQRGTALGWNENLYMLILSAVLLMVYLGVGYVRRIPFYRQVGEACSAGGLDSALQVQSAVTQEQQVLQELLQVQYRLYEEELLRHRQREDQHHTFMNQWVHQMKTPVSVIDLLVQQSGEASTEEERTELFGSIAEETERLIQGLDLVLHAARLDKLELDTQFRRVELISLVRRTINDYKKTWIRRSIYPKVETGLEEAVVETDEKWMSFVLHQLISNAIKYTAVAGKLNARLVFALSRDHERVRLTVRDEGIGIPEQDLPRIFDPFFTGENGRRTKEATGMGLFLAKQVCGRLGHGLEAESAPGRGTAMTLTFTPQAGLHGTLRADG